MKENEQEIRDQLSGGRPFTLVTASGERVKVRSHDHVSLPPFEDENGNALLDGQRSEFFEVWTDGRAKRWVAFKSVNIIETKTPDQY